MKRYTLLAIAIVCYLGTEAQQDPQFTQWMFDRLSFNPAVAGTSDQNCLSFFYRDQWDMLERDPKTVMLNYHQRFDDVAPWLGAGVTFYNDRLGQENNNVFKLSGSYIHTMGNGDLLSGGLSLGFYGKTLGDDWRSIDPVDLDNAIDNTVQQAGTFDLGLGVQYLRPGKFYAGLSSSHLTGQDMEDLNIEIARHYWFMAGGQIALPGGNLELRPNALVKSDGVSTTVDLNAHLMINNFVWFGASYRVQDAIAPMAGFQYQLNDIQNGNKSFEHNLRLGYSYDISTGGLKDYNEGSHEIMLTYCFNIRLKPIRKPYSNPRFMGREL